VIAVLRRPAILGTLLALVAAGLAPAAASAACPCTLFPSTATPVTDTQFDNAAVELGVKFRSDTAGFVTGVRFYKGTRNTGTHIGNLWTSTGTLLATAQFANETASGWQQVNFGSPVQIQANTTYVASYHTDVGFYSSDNNFYASAGVDAPPLHAPSDASAGGQNVYRYGTTGFPSFSFSATNYWVDVVFDDTPPADKAPPLVTGRTPASGATDVPTNTTVTATFSEPIQAGSAAIALTGPSGAVSGTTTYDAPSRTATFTPSAALANSAHYTVNVSGATDLSGNTMSPVSWAFDTAAPPPPPPPPGSGPVQVVTSSANPFTSYLGEILRAEGLPEFSTVDVSQFSASSLAGKDVVVVGDTGLSAAQVTALTDFVNAGGSLIAMRPDAKLAPLLGLTKGTGTRVNTYFATNPAVEAAAGITSATMQFHGTADRYTLSGATSVANLYTSATASTAEPAVSLRTVGTNGGQAAAFTFDLARSVVYTRQGNPAWEGQSRDDEFPIRSHELFRGVTVADWVNLAKVSIPQADEQQRLFANLIETMNRHRKPLPRLWYFPRSLKAVVVGTGDDHAGGGTAGRFNQYLANSPAGCTVADWTCPRFTSYIYTATPLSNSAAAGYDAQGFEVALHPDTDCEDYTPASLANTFSTQLSQWHAKYTSLPGPLTNRTHCLVWSDWLGEPTTELANGERFDVTYYYWPSGWIKNRPGFMTGSGIPMRFAAKTGAAIDVYQSPTEMTDESGQSYPMTVNTLLDNALGANGYYGAFTTNFHTDGDTTAENDQMMASAKARNVPIVSARQMLRWTDGRNASTIGNIASSGGTLTFDITPGPNTTGLTAMLPTASANGLLTSITRSGSQVAFTKQTIKGLEYAFFPATAGSYSAQYGSAAAAPAVTQLSAATTEAGTAMVDWDTSQPATTEVLYTNGGGEPDQVVAVADATRKHHLELPQMRPGYAYRYRVRSRNQFGDVTVSPPLGSPPATYTVPRKPTAAAAIGTVRAVALPDRTASVQWPTGRRADATVDYGTSANALTLEQGDPDPAVVHEIDLPDLMPGQRYYYRVTSTTPWGTTESSAVQSFTTPDYGVAESRDAQWQLGDRSGIATPQRGDGELRLRDGQTDGTYRSRLLDIDQMVQWRRLVLDADVPAGTSATVQVRTGSTSTGTEGWSDWTTVAPGSLPAGLAPSRYLQYRIRLTGSGGATPVIRGVGFTSSGVYVPAPTEMGG
jgi:hypothetical protein